MTSPPLYDPVETLGLAALARAASDAIALNEIWDALMARLAEDPGDAGALLDLSTVLQLTGNRDKGLELQATALLMRRCFRRRHGDGSGLRVMVFATAGDFMANTPVDFLFEGSDTEAMFVYLDGLPPPATMLPEHDVAIMAIGESEANDSLLQDLAGAFQAWPRPVLNQNTERVAALTRNGVADAFAGNADVLAPRTVRIAREDLATAAADIGFPLILRPVGAHAGHGLEKLTAAVDIAGYLSGQDAAEFYVSAFVDYSGPDGLFRKLRVVFIEGRAYISHMAVSPRWMVHYLNADMAESPANRAEEAEMMRTFDDGFARRQARACEALMDAFQLEYFGIDCAETADGRLLLFEADVAMIVHAMDPADIYDYKKPAMAKLFAAFTRALENAARG